MEEHSDRKALLSTAGPGLILLAGLVAYFTLIQQPAPPAETGPTLPRSERLELTSVAALVTVRPQVTWLAPLPSGPGWGALEVGPAPKLAGLEQRGATLFRSLCASCHGEGGEGEGVFARELPRNPRNLRGALRTRRSGGGRCTPDELFRTVTVGAPRYGMPAFGHLSRDDRWALVSYVYGLAPAASPAKPLTLPPRPAQIDLHLGQDVFRAKCASCHGTSGDGKGPLAKSLVDALRDPCPPTDFTHGPAAFRSGARAEDVVRAVMLGRPGTPMAAVSLPPDQLWAVGAYVAYVAEVGLAQRRQRWQAFFANLRSGVDLREAEVGKSPRRWSKKLSAKFATTPAGKQGCLACHRGIEDIAQGRMKESLIAMGGGDGERTCLVCHEGRPNATTKVDAHRGMIGNPGSLWITSIGMGCGKCHSTRDALTSLMGRTFPEPTGGGLMDVVSRQTDPSGKSGGNHAYRMQRALMAQESGKVLLMTSSAGLTTPDKPLYTDFPLDDPDGPIPSAGTDAYRAFVKRAREKGYLQQLARSQGLPTYHEALELTKKETLAGYIDYFRKDCARCHLWSEGKPIRGEYRSSGCSACHVLNDKNARTQSKDPTIPRRISGHPMRHELVMAPPEQQCNHCHTRGAATEHSEAHQRAGIGCGDCHTSIDVHGDGNIYPSIEHQLEIRCEDCHGTSTMAPWELPVGAGTPAAGKGSRGVYERKGVRHLLTNRGNPRTAWFRVGDKAFLKSYYTNKRHRIPLLKESKRRKISAEVQKAHGQPGHQKLSCSLCHNRKSPRCTPCHLTYFRTMPAEDWILSAWMHDAQTTRQRIVKTPGAGDIRALGGAGMPWGPPETRTDRSGRKVPRVPGCDMYFTFVGAKGKVLNWIPKMNPGDKTYPPPIAPTLTHEFAIPARACNECHIEGTGPGKPIRLPGANRR